LTGWATARTSWENTRLGWAMRPPSSLLASNSSDPLWLPSRSQDRKTKLFLSDPANFEKRKPESFWKFTVKNLTINNILYPEIWLLFSYSFDVSVLNFLFGENYFFVKCNFCKIILGNKEKFLLFYYFEHDYPILRNIVLLQMFNTL
jgi:hypothetical protein